MISIIILFIQLIQVINAQTNKCDFAIPIKITPTNKYDEQYGDIIKDGKEYKWQYEGGEISGNSPGMLYVIQSPIPMKVKLSTCYSHTNFPAYIRVFDKCSDVFESWVSIQNDDVEGVCGHILSRIVIEIEANKPYYILISSTTNVYGVFKLRSERVDKEDTNNFSRSKSLEMIIPSIVDQRITPECSDQIIPSAGMVVAGRWFSFQAISENVTIDTCSKYTSLSTTIHVTDNNLNLIASSSEGCESNARLLLTNLTKGNTYFFVVTSTGEINYDIATFQLSIYQESEYQHCQKAYGISESPFKMDFDFSNLPITSTQVENNQTITGRSMYFVIASNNNQRVFTTVYTNTISNQTQTKILISESCENFKTLEHTHHENYALIESQENKNTYIQVVCTQEPCAIIVSLIETMIITNTECSSATQVSITQGETFYQLVSPVYLTNTSTNGYSGTWYHFVQQEKDLLTIGVTPHLVFLHQFYMEIFKDCNSIEPIEKTQIVQQIQLTDFYVFATCIASLETKEKGFYIFWAVYSPETLGKYPSSAILIDHYPFTQIYTLLHEVSVPRFNVSSSDYFYGVWFKFQNNYLYKYSLSSCGGNTNLMSNLKIYADIKGPESLDVVDSRIYSCGFGKKTEISFDENAMTYILLYANNTGTVRFSFYVDERSESSLCTKAIPISQTTTIRGYTEKSYTTESFCRIIGSLKGMWYQLNIKSKANVTVTINSSTSFKSVIEIYADCNVIQYDSVPKICLKYADAATSPIGLNGCYLSFHVESKRSLFMFIGGIDRDEYGIFEGKVIIDYEEENSDESSNEQQSFDNNSIITTSQIAWIVFGVIYYVYSICIICILFIAYFIKLYQPQFIDEREHEKLTKNNQANQTKKMQQSSDIEMDELHEV